MRIKRPRQHDEKHLAFIRTLSCLVCRPGNSASTEAAHLRFSDVRVAKVNPGVGQKPSDYWAVPLCGAHHRQQHEIGDELKFWDTATIDPIFVAMALYLNSGDHESCETIIREQH